MSMGISAGTAALIGGGLALGGALISSNASQDAAQTQLQAANNANATQLSMFNTQQANMQPWMQTGKLALSDLQNFMGLGNGNGVTGNGTAPGVAGFKYNPSNDPLYQWTLNQGLGAITNQASALGGVNSGATLKSLSNYAQNQAQTSYQQEFQNWNTQLNNVFNRLSAVSGTGANTAGGIAGLGSQTAGQIGSNIIGAGNAAAAGQVGVANALSGGIQNGMNNYLTLGMMNQNPGMNNLGGMTWDSAANAPYTSGAPWSSNGLFSG